MRIELAYLAGLFDGEGCAGVYRYTSRNNRAYPLMTVQMCDPGPVDEFHRVFGGYRAIQPRKNARRPVHVWLVSHRKALTAAQSLLPYCHNDAKRAQMNEIIRHYTRKH